MAGYVKQQCVAEWRLIDEGNILTRAGFVTVHARDAFLGISPLYEVKPNFPLTCS